MPADLPLLTSPPAVRRDAARNREALLAAAAEMVAENGVTALTTDGLAVRAGVGKGTVFRHFGSREGLMASLLDHVERSWQADVISGPPPLGPGAPARERLLAFGASRLRLQQQEVALIDAAGRTWSSNGAVIGFLVLHVRHLLGELGETGDLAYLAMALMAPLSVPMVQYQLGAGGRTPDQALADWQDFVDLILRSR